MTTAARRAVLGVSLLALAGCSMSNTTATTSGGGRERVYRMSEDEALAIAHRAFLRAFPGLTVETINGPIRGYSTYTRVMLDTFTQQVLAVPMRGTVADGSTVDGFVFEVSGSGTSGTGAMRNASFFNALREDADRTGTGVEVVSMRQRVIPRG